MIDDDKIKRSVKISSGISGSTILASGTISSVDTGSSNLKESLRLNSGDLANAAVVTL